VEYEEEKTMSWSIVNGDCVSHLQGLPERSARLVFADPPYNIGVNYGDHYLDDRSENEFLCWCTEWMNAAASVLTDDGSLWVLVNHELGHRIASIGIDNVGLHLRQTIIWRETFGVCCKRKFNRTSRPLLHFTMSPGKFVFNADSPMIRKASDRLLKYNDKRANPSGKLLDDVWDIPRVCGTFKERIKGFPTQLPVELLRRVVACASDPGDLVIDPFSGSGTTGAACIGLDRRYLGIELSPEFARLSTDRLSKLASKLAG